MQLSLLILTLTLLTRSSCQDTASFCRDKDQLVKPQEYQFIGDQKLLYLVEQRRLTSLSLPFLSNYLDKSKLDLNLRDLFINNVSYNFLANQKFFGFLNDVKSTYSTYGIQNADKNKQKFECLEFQSSETFDKVPEVLASQDCGRISKIYRSNLDYLHDIPDSDVYFHYMDEEYQIILSWKDNQLTILPYANTDLDDPFLLKSLKFQQNYTVEKVFVGRTLRQRSHLYLYEIDNKFNIHISLLNTTIKLPDERGNNGKFDVSINHFEMNFFDFIGCYRKIENTTELHGIFYMNDKFYLIFYKYFLVYEQDLVEARFDLSIETPEIKRINFTETPAYVIQKISYELSEFKWVLVADKNVYMEFSRSTPYVFKVQNLEGNVTLKRVDERLAEPCSQILEVNTSVYCFENGTYYKTKFDRGRDDFEKKNVTPVEDIFNEIKDIDQLEDVDLNDTIRFIFTYKDNQLIFITDTYIMRIDYDLFSQVNDTLILKKPKRNQFFVDESCMLRDCSKGHSKRKSSKYKSGSSRYFFTILIVIILSLIISTVLYSSKLAPVRKYIMESKLSKYIEQSNSLSKLKRRIFIKKEKDPFPSPKSNANTSQILGNKSMEPGSESKKYSFLALKNTLGKLKKPNTKPVQSKKTAKVSSTSTFPFFSSKSKERISKGRNAGA